MSKVVDFNEGIYKYLNIKSLGLPTSDYFYKDKKETSIWFKGKEGLRPVDFLKGVFKTNGVMFAKKFNESVSGDGNESEKNYAIKSSSLCALLFFYNVSNDNPIIYKGIKYTKVYFEVKNKVNIRPSNMDVVLVGTKERDDDSILFIESKFSEFIGTTKYPLGEAYKKEPFNHMFDNDVFRYDEQEIFQQGLKQLITHYIGIRNFINADMNIYKEEMKSLYKGKIGDRVHVYKKYENIGFLEIVFEMPQEDDYKKYIAETKLVFESLKKEKQKDDIKLDLYGTVTYQDFFLGNNKAILDGKVKEFYKLD